jgi:hypothetical protein
MGRLAHAALIGALAAALLCGCATERKEKQDEALMLGLLTLLPGQYDNSEQADFDARNHARPGHIAVDLVILRVDTPRLGKNVYYAQETAADDPRRVLSQRMYSFKVEDKGGITETLYEFKEPLRWRDGAQEPDIFTGLEIEDVRAQACQVIWKKDPAGGFSGAHDPKRCPDVPGAPASRVALGLNTLTVGDYRFVKSR